MFLDRTRPARIHGPPDRTAWTNRALCISWDWYPPRSVLDTSSAPARELFRLAQCPKVQHCYRVDCGIQSELAEHPQPTTSSTSGTSWIVTAVSRNPWAVWSVNPCRRNWPRRAPFHTPRTVRNPPRRGIPQETRGNDDGDRGAERRLGGKTAQVGAPGLGGWTFPGSLGGPAEADVDIGFRSLSGVGPPLGALRTVMLSEGVHPVWLQRLHRRRNRRNASGPSAPTPISPRTSSRWPLTSSTRPA